MPKRSDKRDRLINAAAELFWLHGYAATSLADIAKASGVPLGNVYYYFRTKAELADAVADLFVAQMSGALSDIEGRYPDPADRIGAFFNLISASNAARATRGCPIARAINDLPEAGAAIGRRAGEPFTVMLDWLGRQARSAGLADPDLRTERAVAEWQGAIVLARARGDQGLLDTALKRIRRQFISGY